MNSGNTTPGLVQVSRANETMSSMGSIRAVDERTYMVSPFPNVRPLPCSRRGGNVVN